MTKPCATINSVFWDDLDQSRDQKIVPSSPLADELKRQGIELSGNNRVIAYCVPNSPVYVKYFFLVDDDALIGDFNCVYVVEYKYCVKNKTSLLYLYKGCGKFGTKESPAHLDSSKLWPTLLQSDYFATLLVDCQICGNMLDPNWRGVKSGNGKGIQQVNLDA